MVYAYEFEIYRDGEFYLADPFDMLGGTQGYSMQEICEMAADWLKIEIEERLMRDIPVPKATFGNELRNGGERLVVAIETSLDAIPRMTAAEAARRLGVTPARVSQMVKAAKLQGFKIGGTMYVTENSVRSRLIDHPKAGRPKKKRVQNEGEATKEA